MSISKDLCWTTIKHVVDGLGLTEQLGEDGGAYLPIPLTIPGQPPGECRVWTGPGVSRMVYVGLAFAPANIDSHMVFCFGDDESAIPHYTVDSVSVGTHYSIHCDLIPRLDIGANRSYLDTVFLPLSDTYDTVLGMDGITPAQLSRRQYAVMSPWMLVGRFTEEAFAAMYDHIKAYTDHWLALAKNGVPEAALEGATAQEIAARNKRNRAMIFSPEIDPVWGQIEGMIGPEMGERLRALLRADTPL